MSNSIATKLFSRETLLQGNFLPFNLNDLNDFWFPFWANHSTANRSGSAAEHSETLSVDHWRAGESYRAMVAKFETNCTSRTVRGKLSAANSRAIGAGRNQARIFFAKLFAMQTLHWTFLIVSYFFQLIRGPFWILSIFENENPKLFRSNFSKLRNQALERIALAKTLETLVSVF